MFTHVSLKNTRRFRYQHRLAYQHLPGLKNILYMGLIDGSISPHPFAAIRPQHASRHRLGRLRSSLSPSSNGLDEPPCRNYGCCDAPSPLIRGNQIQLYRLSGFCAVPGATIQMRFLARKKLCSCRCSTLRSARFFSCRVPQNGSHRLTTSSASIWPAHHATLFWDNCFEQC